MPPPPPPPPPPLPGTVKIAPKPKPLVSSAKSAGGGANSAGGGGRGFILPPFPLGKGAARPPSSVSLSSPVSSPAPPAPPPMLSGGPPPPPPPPPPLPGTIKTTPKSPAGSSVVVGGSGAKTAAGAAGGGAKGGGGGGGFILPPFPLAKGAARPPSLVSARPPSSVSARPPSSVSARPPSSVSARPPSSVSARPPSSVSARPPSSVSASSPIGSSPAPPPPPAPRPTLSGGPPPPPPPPPPLPGTVKTTLKSPAGGSGAGNANTAAGDGAKGGGGGGGFVLPSLHQGKELARAPSFSPTASRPPIGSSPTQQPPPALSPILSGSATPTHAPPSTYPPPVLQRTNGSGPSVSNASAKTSSPPQTRVKGALPSQGGALPPPPPSRAATTRLTSNGDSPLPPVPCHSPKRSYLDSTGSATSPSPPLHRQGSISSSPIPPPPIVKNSHDQARVQPPPPPVRVSSSVGSGAGAPPPPPIRRGSKKSTSVSPPLGPQLGGQGSPQLGGQGGPQLGGQGGPQLGGKPLPPQPPQRSENTNIEKNKSIPPPPQIQSRQSSNDGQEDYDVPRPYTNRYSDYDIPVTQEMRETREKTIRGEAVTGEGDYSVPITKEERLWKEKGLSTDGSSSGGGSRPLSNVSSVFSADASVMSSHSSGSGKLVAPPEEDASSSIDLQLEMINQMVGDVAAISLSKKMSAFSTEGMLSTMKTLDEDTYSHCSSSDNLGVWDDVSSEPDSDELEGNGANTKSGMDYREEEELLENWIKELEQGMAGMTGVTGSKSPTATPMPPPSVAAPPPPSTAGPPPPSTPLLNPPSTALHPPSTTISTVSEGTTKKPKEVRRRSRTEKEMARVSNWRLSMKLMEEAEDPDLDALLADICQLEEDTKKQLTSSSLEVNSPSNSVSNTGKSKGGMSSDDFVWYMEGLQDSRNIISDPSRSVSMATYDAPSKGPAKDISLELISQLSDIVDDTDPGDIFSRESLLMRKNTTPRASTLPRKNRNSSLRRSQKHSDVGAGASHGNAAEGTTVSPTHKAVQKQLYDFTEGLKIDETLTPEQQIQKLKVEKLKIAMMKLKEASVQKVVLKVSNVDGSTKMVAIHETMTAKDVCILLAERNHQQMGPNWTLVERLSDLHLERTFEDHELVLDCISHWPRTQNNNIMFKNNPDKYYIIKRPQLLMPGSHAYSSVNQQRSAFSEQQKKNIILKELFVSKILPKLEGDLHIREGKRGSWKKHMFVLRASGLYYSKSGKSLASKDIARVTEWKDVECYTGTQYKKFYRAPGHHCFSLLPHGPMNKVESSIIHICVPTKHELLAWMTGIRLARYGNKLQSDYDEMKGEMPWLQLEDENLDSLKTTSIPNKGPNAATPELATIAVNGKEVSQDSNKKGGKFGTLKGSFQYKGDSTDVPNENHVISGPLGQSSSTRKRKRNPSILATAFVNAWKQGNLTEEMSRDTEKWPIFDRSSSFKNGKKGSFKERTDHTDSLPFVEEGNNSGMFTLRRNPDHKKRSPVPSSNQPSSGSQPAPPPPPQHSAPPPSQPVQAAPPTVPGDPLPPLPSLPTQGYPPPPAMAPPLLQDRQSIASAGGAMVAPRTADYPNGEQLRYSRS